MPEFPKFAITYSVSENEESSQVNQEKMNRNMPYANLFGHVHDSPIIKTCSGYHYCVSVERINYTPISFEEIILAVQNKTEENNTQ